MTSLSFSNFGLLCSSPFERSVAFIPRWLLILFQPRAGGPANSKVTEACCPCGATLGAEGISQGEGRDEVVNAEAGRHSRHSGTKPEAGQGTRHGASPTDPAPSGGTTCPAHTLSAPGRKTGPQCGQESPPQGPPPPMGGFLPILFAQREEMSSLHRQVLCTACCAVPGSSKH